MKILEMLDPPVTTHTVKRLDSPDMSVGRTKNKAIERMGRGNFATVVYNKNHPGQVIKVSKKIDNIEKDGYFNYIKSIIENGSMNGNPYFPKVYKVKLYHKPEQEPNSNRPNLASENRQAYAYTVELEKLHRLSSLRAEELMAIGDRIFEDFEGLVEKYEQRFGSGDDDDIGEPSSGDPNDDKILNVLAYCLESLRRKNHPFGIKVKDEQFAEALQLITEKLKTGDFSYDIREANCMVRRTSIGPQLVITDPLA